MLRYRFVPGVRTFQKTAVVMLLHIREMLRPGINQLMNKYIELEFKPEQILTKATDRILLRGGGKSSRHQLTYLVEVWVYFIQALRGLRSSSRRWESGC